MRSLWLLLLLVVWACESDPQPQRPKQAKNLCKYSELLTITPAKNGFLIQIKNPEQPKEKFSFQLEQPFKRIAVLSATHVGMLSALEQQHRLCAIPDKRYLHDPLIKKAVAQGKVADLKSAQQLSIKKLLARHTQALVFSGFGPEQTQIKRLRSIGLTCIPNYEWRETHPLARAEWVLLFGALTGQFEKAQQYFKQVCQNYKRIRTQPNLCNSNPFVISGYVYGDQWVAPAANSFEARLYADVDFAYYFNKRAGTGSCFSSIQSVLAKSTGVVLWLNPGQPTRAALLQQYPKYKYFPFFKKRIFCYTHNTNFYWECAAAHPDWVLSDLSQIRNGNVKKLHFYKELRP
jgi:iron complex transport system substrate-binding protein